MVEVRFACINEVAGVKCTLDGEVQYSNEIGIASFFGVAQGEHTYSVEKEGMQVVSGEDQFGRPLYDSGITVIEWAPLPGTPWPYDQWLMAFTFEVAEVDEPPTEVSSLLGKVGAVAASLSFVGIILDSARKR